MAKTRNSSDPADWSEGSQPSRRNTHDRPDEGGRAARFLAVACGAVVATAIVGLLSRLADVPRGSSLILLELAGTTDRARHWLNPANSAHQVSIPEVHQALLADLLLIAVYVTGLFAATQRIDRAARRHGATRNPRGPRYWVATNRPTT